MKIRYIAIEREYGSGGSTIAKETAKVCGIPCYGNEILEAVAKEQQRSVEEIQRYEETVSNSFLYSMLMVSQAQSATPDLLTPESKLYLAEHQVIRQFAEQGPAIFLGHCAAEALRERDDVLRVFIRAEQDDKNKRIVQDYGVSPKQAESVAKKFDKKRSNYYTFNTSKRWESMQNYHLVLDSSALGMEGCVKLLQFLFTR